MDNKFKVGDKVALSKDSEYIENEDGFQLPKGVVGKIDISERDNYYVVWRDCEERVGNYYQAKDLVLAEETPENNKVLKMLYKNYRGAYSEREIIPHQVVFKHSDWHGECWIMEAYDLGKGAEREFKVEDIVKWL